MTEGNTATGKRETIFPEYGSAIKHYRKLRGMKAKDLAIKCDIHRGWLSMIERNVQRPSTTVIEKVSHALGIKMSALLEFAEQGCLANITVAEALKISQK